MRLSLAMIVRNEQESLSQVLAEAGGFCDELIVVDTGSDDGSRDIALTAGATVVDFDWVDDFAAARNFAFDQCTGEWIIWLDADDHVPAAVQAAYRAAKDTLLTHQIDAVYAPYRYAFDAETGLCTYQFPRERVIRRGARLRWHGVVHETLTIPEGRSVYRDDLYIEHRPSAAKLERRIGRNLRILEAAVRAGDRSPRTLFYLGNELRDNERFSEAVAFYREFLDTGAAAPWEEYAARLSMGICAKNLGRLDDALGQFFYALRRDPTRSEAYLRIGEVHFEEQEWAKALPLFTAATNATRPSVGFVNDADYTWLPWDYVGVCLAQLGRHDDAVAAMLTSLRAGNPQGERLHHNLRWSIDQR
ncbi:MAG: hypothetical protein QOD91_358 [Frankiales bacterium]|nr:hypothetical protein [Frankiales bacterium]